MEFIAHLVFGPASCSPVVRSAAEVAALLYVVGIFHALVAFQSVFCLFVQHLLRPSDVCSPPHSVSLSPTCFCPPFIVYVEKWGAIYLFFGKTKLSIEETFILLNCRWYTLVSLQLQV